MPGLLRQLLTAGNRLAPVVPVLVVPVAPAVAVAPAAAPVVAVVPVVAAWVALVVGFRFVNFVVRVVAAWHHLSEPIQSFQNLHSTRQSLEVPRKSWAQRRH